MSRGLSFQQLASPPLSPFNRPTFVRHLLLACPIPRQFPSRFVFVYSVRSTTTSASLPLRWLMMPPPISQVFSRGEHHRRPRRPGNYNFAWLPAETYSRPPLLFIRRSRSRRRETIVPIISFLRRARVCLVAKCHVEATLGREGRGIFLGPEFVGSSFLTHLDSFS